MTDPFDLLRDAVVTDDGVVEDGPQTILANERDRLKAFIAEHKALDVADCDWGDDCDIHHETP